MQLETIGTGPRVVLVHGGVVGPAAWDGHSAQRAPGFDERLGDFLDRADRGVSPY